MPAVSVVVPSYNVAPYIGECIRSLQNQTLHDFEVIIVDDHSSDDSCACAQAAIEGDDRFTLIALPENNGQSHARNVGIEHASGTYITFLDADDYYEDTALAQLSKRAQRDRLDLLFFSASTFYESRELRRTHNENQDDRADIDGVMAGTDLFVSFEDTESFRPSACLFVMRRSLLESSSLRFEEGIIHEDLLFTILAMAQGKRTAFMNTSLYHRRMREGSTMTTKRGMRNINGLFTVALRLQEWLHEHVDLLSSSYVDAFCHELFITWDQLARDSNRVTKQELDAYRDGLSASDRATFDLIVFEHGKMLDSVYHEVYDSLTFRIGRVFMAFPSWLKSRIKMPS